MNWIIYVLRLSVFFALLIPLGLLCISLIFFVCLFGDAPGGIVQKFDPVWDFIGGQIIDPVFDPPC